MKKLALLLLVLLSHTLSGVSQAQTYNSFKFVGQPPTLSAGSVTSIEFEANLGLADAKLSYLDAAGVSSVYQLRFSASSNIRSNMAVFMPEPAFDQFSNTDLELDKVNFVTGKLIHPQGERTPPHWFRLTQHDNAWSGVFRVGDKVYSLDRINNDGVISMRSTSTVNSIFQPEKRVKVTAVIDQNYVRGNNTLGHLIALESLHILDGLASDTLGISVNVEQIVFQQSYQLSSRSLDAPTATEWLKDNSDAFGIGDNLATLFFTGYGPVPGTVQDKSIVIGKSDNYQFVSSHLFGKLLDLPDEPNSLQNYVAGNTEQLASAQWTESQRTHLDNFPPDASLVQTLSYDEPEIIETEPESNNVIEQNLIDSDYEESTGRAPGLQNDSNQTLSTSSGSGGGGGFGLLILACILIMGPRKLAAP